MSRNRTIATLGHVWLVIPGPSIWLFQLVYRVSIVVINL